MRVLGIVVAVVLFVVAALMAVVTISLFVDGSTGSGVLAAVFLAITLLAAVLLVRTSTGAGRRPAGGQPPRRGRRDQGLYYGDTPVSYGYAGGVWGGDGGADGRHAGGSSGHGHGHDYGGGGSFASDGGSSSGSDGGGGGGGGSD